MANLKSQIKRNRQNEKRRLRNRVLRGEARTAIKNTRLMIEEGKTEESKTALQEAIRALDKASEKGVIHKNNAARRKSRLMKRFSLMGLHKAKMVEGKDKIASETKKVSRAKVEPKQAAKKATDLKIAIEGKAASDKTKPKKQ